MSKEIAEEYASSLADLTVNSKPLINMLTILAEENIDHAGTIVETVEKHLEKVQPEIKLPVLYLVDSIIKNVGGAYTQKFSQSIVNMFTRTFKQVDEKIRSQMFKLRETWHDVFPATKLYQLDVKVNLIDPAWPIQAQPQQSNIHVNPNFLKKNPAPAPTNSVVPAAPVAPVANEEEEMRSILAKKEQELLLLQRKKVEMDLARTRRQLEMAEKTVKTREKKVSTVLPQAGPPPTATVSPLNAPAPAPKSAPAPEPATLPLPAPVPVKSRLGPPVHKGGRIAPVSANLAAARRDPRLARHPSAVPAPPPPPHIAPPPTPIASNVFDIKPLERITKRKNVITIDVNPDAAVAREPRDNRDPRRRDPRLDKRAEARRARNERRNDNRNDDKAEKASKVSVENERNDKKKPEDDKRKVEEEKEKRKEEPRKIELETKSDENDVDKITVNKYLDQLFVPDPKKINKLPPIPKINRDEPKKEAEKDTPSPVKRKKETVRLERKKKRENNHASGKDSSSGSSPDKKFKNHNERKLRSKDKEASTAEADVVAFKELKNYHKERYMRRNKEKSESPETIGEKMQEDKPAETESSSVPDVPLETKDVDLRVLPSVEPKAAVVQKRSSTDALESKAKKNKLDKFDKLFGNEDVDLRQLPELPQVEETGLNASGSPKMDVDEDERLSPQISPNLRDWHEIKERKETDEVKKTPSKLDLVRAKLAEATKSKDKSGGKDRLGRPLLFRKSPSVERERRRTVSTEDVDLRTENADEFDAEDHKKTISIIMSQAKEQFSDGKLDKSQYNALMFQVLQLNEKLKLKEAKQRESLEISKMKLKAHTNDDNTLPRPKSPNTFGDIDERVTPMFIDAPSDSQGFLQDSDMRVGMADNVDGHRGPGLLPLPPPMPMFMGPGPYPSPNWRGPRPRLEDFGPRRFRAPMPPFYRGKFDKRGGRQPFDPRMMPPLPTPKIGMCQGECPVRLYERVSSPPPLGAPGLPLPPTDFRVIEYIDQDPVKTIQIDGVPREIRFYGETAVIMLDWDDPREIKFLPGCRRVTFDNKDSVVLAFNEPYKQVEIDDQVFDIRFGAPTRELFINGRWFECYFGGQPFGVIIDGKPRLVHLEGPLPQVDIGEKRTDLVAGKINLIVNATQMCPVYLDAKVQKFMLNGQFFTIRFVDCLRTVLINDRPFRVEYGDLPKPITIGNEKYFIRFSALPKGIKAGQHSIVDMEGRPAIPRPQLSLPSLDMDVGVEPLPRPPKTPSPEGETQGLDMLASVMPSSMETPASASAYSVAEPLFSRNDKIPGLETPSEEKPAMPMLPNLGNINVTDLFAKLVATGIVQMPVEAKKEEPKEEVKKLIEDKTVLHRVDLLRPETLRVKQPAMVSRLYGGMQCSGCGARFPPEHTVRYSQHLDWHFRQNRRERDSARRAHSRHWHYDLCDWLQYEELEDAEEREKSWFETGNPDPEAAAAPAEAPSAAAEAPRDTHCNLCGDLFHQFYNEDKEEWHLRNAVRYEEAYYHPVCLEDYKASLTKPEVLNDSEVIPLEKEEPIEIRDADDADDEGALSDEDVELVEPDPEPLPPPVEIDGDDILDDGDEDDVVLKAEPVVEVTVDDDNDTDDETMAERAARDEKVALDLANIKIKQEPVDPDDEPIIMAEEQTIQPVIDTTHTTVLSSIDGNVQLEAAAVPASTLPPGGIKINISKSLPAFVSAPPPPEDGLQDISLEDEPLPPGEEPELEYKLKPSLEGVQFIRQPPVQKGSELSGLCSIM